MKFTIRLSVIFFILIGLSQGAMAITLNFDDGSSGTPLGSDYHGFDFSNSASVQFFKINAAAHSGDSVLLRNNRTSNPIIIRKTGGGTFNFIDTFIKDHDSSGISGLVTGKLNGATINTANFTTSGSSFTQIIGNFSGIDELVFQANGNGVIELDDLTLNDTAAVPEPSSFILFGLAALAFGFRKRT